MSQGTPRPDLHRVASLAAAYALHDLRRNDDGLAAVLTEVHEGGPEMLGNFIRALSGLVLAYGERTYPSRPDLEAALSRHVLSFRQQGEADG